MRRLFYHQDFTDIWMVISQDKVPTYVEMKEQLVILYNQAEIIGYNFLNMPELINGYNELDINNLSKINEILFKNGLELWDVEVNSIVIGEIVELKVIEGKGFVCQVDIGKKVLQIVTKSTNVWVKQKVVCVLDGGVLANGEVVNSGIIYQHLSQGVFGSKRSLLRLNEDVGQIIVLNDEAPIGSRDWRDELCLKN